MLEYPQYTKPREFRGMTVPEVLLNGNHQEIAIGGLNRACYAPASAAATCCRPSDPK